MTILNTIKKISSRSIRGLLSRMGVITMRDFDNNVSSDEKKASQVAGRFLELSGGSINYMLLLKMMYMVDRTALSRWDRPVTNDTYWSLRHGPILSAVYDLIADEPASPDEGFWVSHISTPNNYYVRLTKPTGDDELSSLEKSLIDEVYAQYGQMDPFDLAELLHKTLPEWKNPGDTRLPIFIHDILIAIGRSDEEAREIVSEIRSVRVVDSIFA